MGRVTGYTSASPEKFLLDAGAFLINYDKDKTYTENVTAGALIGATVGGGSFSAVPTIRKMEADGAKGNVKGLQTIDDWAVTLVANAKEVTVDNMKTALGAATSTSASGTGVTGGTSIKANAKITDTDYIDNVAWIGKKANGDSVIIIIDNALSLNGLSMTFADQNEASIPITLTAHYDPDDLETVPFEIIDLPAV